MIPIIDDFVNRFNIRDFIVVADAGLLSRKNIELLKSAGYKFILGGCIKKESSKVIDWGVPLTKSGVAAKLLNLFQDEKYFRSPPNRECRS